ncbi:HEPN domain-containing protein [Candidatus Wolfebacteria bacterium]|nr:HEPN domain-containing protein [Candidatus Wolfebacteria bacterium]
MDDQTRKEIEEYLSNARDRIKSAEILKDAGQYSDAISRIYYSLFNAATAALLSKKLTAKTHHGLVLLFEENFVETGIIKPEIGRWLRRSKEAREAADYEVYKKFDKGTVEAGIKAAKEFVADIEKIVL